MGSSSTLAGAAAATETKKPHVTWSDTMPKAFRQSHDFLRRETSSSSAAANKRESVVWNLKGRKDMTLIHTKKVFFFHLSRSVSRFISTSREHSSLITSNRLFTPPPPTQHLTFQRLHVIPCYTTKSEFDIWLQSIPSIRNVDPQRKMMTSGVGQCIDTFLSGRIALLSRGVCTRNMSKIK